MIRPLPWRRALEEQRPRDRQQIRRICTMIHPLPWRRALEERRPRDKQQIRWRICRMVGKWIPLFHPLLSMMIHPLPWRRALEERRPRDKQQIRWIRWRICRMLGKWIPLFHPLLSRPVLRVRQSCNPKETTLSKAWTKGHSLYGNLQYLM